MNAPAAVAPPKTSMVELTEKDLPELAIFVAAQSGQDLNATLSRLTWLLLENPVRSEWASLGCGVRSARDGLVGCILHLPQMFVFQRAPLLVLGSSCFYVDERYRGCGGALFLKFARAASQHPLFGNSANAVAAQLWKARGASPMANSDHELLGAVNWQPVAEEFAIRRGAAKGVARALGAATGWLRHVRKLRLPVDKDSRLEQLCSLDEVMRLPLAEPTNCFTAARNDSYIRWRYFSRRDPSIALFAYRSGRDRGPVFVAVNERLRGHRSQIRSLNLLDVFPRANPDAMNAIVAALHEKYRHAADMIVLRGLDVACQAAFQDAGFFRRSFDSPNGWLLDPKNLQPTGEHYFVPADGDWIL